MREALHYQPHHSGVICNLCPKNCIVSEGKTGFCRVRKNISGKLYAQNYAACSSSALDPIEKKPLFHFYPGKYILSVGTWGCNFSCQFCQNWQIAQESPQVVELPPDRLVHIAKEQGLRNVGIAFTYSEPSVWYEYILDTAIASKAAGLKNVLVTNGFINQKPLEELLPHIDALNIDVKAFNNEFYYKICSGFLDDVKRTVELSASRCHVEITTLVVPDLNDAEQELNDLAEWLGSISPDIPLHFSRYFPNYKMDKPATPITTMQRAYEIAKEYLNYVYLGNVGTNGINTCCPVCSELIIDRLKRVSYLKDEKKCPHCGSCIKIIGEVDF
ncbi:AmmeMemoRadiSam system radical SAM enzyme [Dendrosporobacter sp. 1207_IL3150]|uniref:AmmeMemoRadiSam system radical SAM enzyme n=1 Tax=Dendrosporobacter sp. 1207_IL3150 TaxID=3084054 RepID=UPI002FDAEA5F